MRYQKPIYMTIFNCIILILVFCTAPAGVLWICKKVPFLGKIGPVLLLYILGVIIGNIGIRPEGFILGEGDGGALTFHLTEVEVMGRDISVVCSHKVCESGTIRAIIGSENIKRVGDVVQVGESIAIVDGKQLWFELWQDGKAINPEEVIAF